MEPSRLANTLVLTWICLSCTAAALASPTGRIEGRLTRSDGSAMAGVAVTALESSARATTDADGRFVLTVEPGNYTVHLESGKLSEDVLLVAVPFNGVARLEQTLDWKRPRSERSTVARRPTAAATTTFVADPGEAERVDLPTVAATTTGAEAVERAAPHGQVPKLVEHDAAVSTGASSRYGFNLNTRGFNGASNRRTQVLVDGRDPSEVFFGGQEWASLSFPFGDLAEVELEHGPSSALHGANAAGGVLNLVTRPPSSSRGGELRLAGGEQDTLNAEARFAFALSGRSYLKLMGATREDDDFTVSRRDRAEYSVLCDAGVVSDCLPREAVAVDPGGNDLGFGSVRFDHHFDSGPLLSFEAGVGDVSGPVVLSDLGRQQIRDAVHRWTRLHYSSEHWSFLGTSKNRDADEQTALATGGNLALDSTTWKGELTTRWNLFGDRLLLVAGASHEDERIDSLDPDGPTRPSLLNGLNRQTLLFEPVIAETDAFFVRFDWRLADNLQISVAGRYDDSSLYDPQWSPRASLVYAVDAHQTLRFTYHEGFVAPSFAQLFLNFDLEAPLNLARLERICGDDGVACGFDVDFVPGEDPDLDTSADTRILAAGNEGLDVEQTRAWEIGYHARLGDRLRLDVGVHSAEHEDFISDLLPQLNGSFGRTNPNFGFYEPPVGLSDMNFQELLTELETELGALLPFLTNTVDGTAVLVLSSYTNLGEVETRGVDLDLDWQIGRGWSLAFSYSWLDFDVERDVPEFADQLLPNVPENRAALGLAYSGERWNASLGGRWFDDFRWASRPFRGDVDATTVVDLAAGVDLSEHWALGVYISNLLDEEYFAVFGGDLLERRGLASLRFSW